MGLYHWLKFLSWKIRLNRFGVLREAKLPFNIILAWNGYFSSFLRITLLVEFPAWEKVRALILNLSIISIASHVRICSFLTSLLITRLPTIIRNDTSTRSKLFITMSESALTAVLTTSFISVKHTKSDLLSPLISCFSCKTLLILLWLLFTYCLTAIINDRFGYFLCIRFQLGCFFLRLPVSNRCFGSRRAFCLVS